MGARFPRNHRLRDSRDFRRISKASGRVASAAFVCLAASPHESAGPNPGERLGLTVSRRVGPAVVRNRIKRQLREWFRHRAHPSDAARDLVVIARTRAGALTRREVRAELARLGAELDRRWSRS